MLPDIFDPKYTIAIVGNAGNEIGKQKGKVIDSFDCVVRFNNYSIDEKYRADYGKYTFAWCCTFWSDTDYRNKTGYDHVFCPMPMQDEKWIKHFGSVNHEALKHYNAICIPLELYEELLKNIESPSSGLAFVWWMYKVRGYMDWNSIFGFSFFDKQYPHHYSDNDQKTGNHHNEQERNLIARMVKKEI